ncbi:MAG: thiolase family protein [Candidatus Rokubacteria bacterium]|nr:thiolase family protein [Candidatus Rokubacteria bacterium]
MREVVVLGVGMHRFGKFPETSLRELAGEAGRRALKDAGVLPRQIQAAYFANALAGLLTGQESIRGQVALREVGVAGVPIVNVENACAGGATAFHQAVLAVGSGSCDVALAVGAEKMFVGDTGRTIQALAASADVELTHDMGLQFTAIYAMRIQKRLASGALTLRHLAEVTVKSHRHGCLNPYAQHQKEVTAEEVLASRPIAGPITLLMCSSVSDGAAAAVVCSAEAARGAPQPLVRVLASELRSGAFRSGAGEELSTAARTVRAAYEQAGVGPEEIDLVECHDATAPGELLYYEDLGFCKPGEAGRLLDEGATTIGGRIPFNPSGGLTSRGHPVGATGLAQIAEAVWQLRGQAGPRQVQGARVALTQNSGGWLEGDSAAGAAHLFAV